VQEKKDAVPEHLEGMFALFRILCVTFMSGGWKRGRVSADI
jgi:hypothetical protein